MTRSTAEAALARCLWRGTRHFHGKQGATRALTTTVVVSEVHSLAPCSTSTACEIKQRIQTSGERAHAGSDLVRNAGTALAEVVSPIQGVNALMEAISQSIAARTSGMLGATQAIVRMDEATQQNAALVEESAAAAGSLSGQARQLVQAVQMFRVRNQHRHALPAPHV